MKEIWKAPREMVDSYRTVRLLQLDFNRRLLAAFVFIVLLFCLLIARFTYLQVIKRDEYVLKATTNRITLIPTPPIRGEIVDINGVVLAHNYPAYSLELIPSKIEGKLSDTIAALRQYVDISETDLNRFNKFRAEYHSYEKIPLKLRLAPDEASRLAAQL